MQITPPLLLQKGVLVLKHQAGATRASNVNSHHSSNKNINASGNGVQLRQLLFPQSISKYSKKGSITFFTEGETVTQSGDLVTAIQLAGSRASSRIKFTTRPFLSLKQTQLCHFDFSQHHSKIWQRKAHVSFTHLPCVWGLSNVK